LLQHSPRGSLAKRVDIGPYIVDYTIHRFRQAIGRMSCHKLLQRAAVELTTGGLQLSSEALDLFEYSVGNGYCRLHTLSMTT